MQKHDLFPNDCDEGDGDVNFSGGGVPVVFVIVVGAVFRFSFFPFCFSHLIFLSGQKIKTSLGVSRGYIYSFDQFPISTITSLGHNNPFGQQLFWWAKLRVSSRSFPLYLRVSVHTSFRINGRKQSECESFENRNIARCSKLIFERRSFSFEHVLSISNSKFVKACYLFFYSKRV